MGPVDAIRMKPAPHGSLGELRVWSGRVNRLSKSRGSGQVGSGQEVSKISRVGSGRVKTSQNFRGSGQVGSRRLEILAGQVGSDDPTRPDPTRAVWPDP